MYTSSNTLLCDYVPVGWSVDWLASRLPGWLVGWLVGSLDELLLRVLVGKRDCQLVVGYWLDGGRFEVRVQVHG